jgi:hypothetical protein
VGGDEGVPLLLRFARCCCFFTADFDSFLPADVRLPPVPGPSNRGGNLGLLLLLFFGFVWTIEVTPSLVLEEVDFVVLVAVAADADAVAVVSDFFLLLLSLSLLST